MVGIRVYVDGNVEHAAVVINYFTVDLLQQQRALVPHSCVIVLPQGATPLSSVLFVFLLQNKCQGGLEVKWVQILWGNTAAVHAAAAADDDNDVFPCFICAVSPTRHHRHLLVVKGKVQ